MNDILPLEFYNRDTVEVAHDLLGKKLVREHHGEILSGMIIETEAYLGSADSASHAHRGKSSRNAILFGPPGRAYIYFTYGLHYLLNIVTGTEGVPCGVLIRALKPIEGLSVMKQLRGIENKNLTNGPAKLCQALAIDLSLNGQALYDGKFLWIEDHENFSNKLIKSGPRIGIDYAQEKDRSANLRFWVEEKI